MRRKIIKSLLAMALTVICMMTCSGCYMFIYALGIGAAIADDKINDANKAFTVVQEPIVTCVYNEETQMYDVAIDGVAQNTSEEMWALNYMELILYDEDNNVVDDVYRYYGIYVPASQTWRFWASATTAHPVAYATVSDFGGRID